MIAFFGRRLLHAAPMLLGVATLGFFLLHLAPGDPATALAGEFAHREVLDQQRRSYGLDRSLFAQYLLYVGKLARGDLGTSYYFRAPVTEVILERLPATLLLVVPALVSSVLVGAGLGILLASGARTRRARFLLGLAAASNAVPVFFLAQLLLLVLSVHLELLPVQGMTDSRIEASGLTLWFDNLRHLVLPVASLGLHHLALIAVVTWTSVEGELRRDYVLALRSRGLSDGSVRAHAIRNALLPVIAVVGSRAGALFSGVVLVEAVFAWPGLGRLAILGALSRDYPLVLGLLFFMTLGVLSANFLADVACALLDPRIRLR